MERNIAKIDRAELSEARLIFQNHLIIGDFKAQIGCVRDGGMVEKSWALNAWDT